MKSSRVNEARKGSSSREAELKLAIRRIECGRARTGEPRLSISAVAREVGVSPALIHNHYPAIAQAIRGKVGASTREHGALKQRDLLAERGKNKALRGELLEARAQIAKLASINETLIQEAQDLRARMAGRTVVDIASKRTRG